MILTTQLMEKYGLDYSEAIDRTAEVVGGIEEQMGVNFVVDVQAVRRGHIDNNPDSFYIVYQYTLDNGSVEYAIESTDSMETGFVSLESAYSSEQSGGVSA